MIAIYYICRFLNSFFIKISKKLTGVILSDGKSIGDVKRTRSKGAVVKYDGGSDIT